MRNGDDYLNAAGDDAAAFHRLKEVAAEVRERMLRNLADAHDHGKTQQALADKCQFSRQRIAQFLKEAREEGSV